MPIGSTDPGCARVVRRFRRSELVYHCRPASLAVHVGSHPYLRTADASGKESGVNRNPPMREITRAGKLRRCVGNQPYWMDIVRDARRLQIARFDVGVQADDRIKSANGTQSTRNGLTTASGALARATAVCGKETMKNETGAQKRTRTSTVLPPLGPEPSASTNFAIWAAARIIAAKADYRQ